MKQLSCFVVVGLPFGPSSCSSGASQAQASMKTGFVNQSINPMDHRYVGQAVFDSWGKSGGGKAYIPNFQGTASWYTNGRCAGPVLAPLSTGGPGDYSHPPLVYPISLNSSGPGVQLWSDYSTPLMVMHDGLRIEAYGIPQGHDCTRDFEIQGYNGRVDSVLLAYD